MLLAASTAMYSQQASARIAEELQEALACHMLLCVAMIQEQLGPHLCGRPPGVL